MTPTAEQEPSVSMVEKVARAICQSRHEDPDEDWRQIPGGPMLEIAIRPEDRPRWRHYRSDARAAIAAMRTPTSRMANSAYDARDQHSDFTAPEILYRAMIDAALAEETDTQR